MDAGHNHGVLPDENPATGDYRTRLAIAFGITVTILVAQAVGSIVTGSLALLTDTAHMLTDVVGLLVALIAGALMRRPASATRTWGFRRLEVLSALGQAGLLLAVGLYTAIEGIQRLFAAPEVPSSELLLFGVVGLVANVAAIAVLSSGRGANLNMRAAFLEVLNDALGSLGVIAAAIVIATTGFMQADAFAGLFIAALIVPRAITLMRETCRVLMEFTPAGLDLDDVRRHIVELEHVRDVHDLHASTIATGLPTLSAHIVLEERCFTDGHAADVVQTVRACVAGHFDVRHSTFQVETEHIRAHEPAALAHA